MSEVTIHSVRTHGNPKASRKMDGSYPDSLFQMWALLSGIGETWDLSTQILILAGRESRTRIRAWFSLFGNQPLTYAGPMQGRSEPNCMVQFT